ncbi:hypothetical protein CEXT_277841 [Caerostris extrusa]|uniref:Uncharacterized protein n=1 Tax=Caerostris extrusa TaxID=172846 RepID=A0AAV4TXU0_CAEEX|nr:hypothetical protein CEXT_277841 [Caerostris extrusa]
MFSGFLCLNKDSRLNLKSIEAMKNLCTLSNSAVGNSNPTSGRMFEEAQAETYNHINDSSISLGFPRNGKLLMWIYRSYRIKSKEQ